jgi:predicted enzyme related to lactoylglutathione lyase
MCKLAAVDLRVVLGRVNAMLDRLASLLLTVLLVPAGRDPRGPRSGPRLGWARRLAGRVAVMGKRTQYTPGTFSWTDLTTTDQDGAKAFYGGLFGWEAIDNPIGDGMVYSMMRIGGDDVAAISPQPEQQRDAGAPPTWNSYITVESADAALERARTLGATVHAPAFDVFDVGRMGVTQDPQGAFFLVWEPKAHVGAGLVNAHGALCWNELASPDIDASAEFYRDLFGWTVEPFADSPEPYLVIKNGDRSNGGIRPVMPPGTPPHWLVYFGVDDLESAMGKIGELGGTTLAGPIDIGENKIAVAQDPQGAVFALYAGMFED